MARQTFSINSILGGISPAQYFRSEGQYSASIGVDPDLPLTSTDKRTSGVLIPTVYEKFSGSEVNNQPIAILRTPKTTLIYAVLANGKLISYSSSFGSETLIGTVTGGVANGAFYYNNYIYITTGTDVSRYGPLDGAAALTNTVWTGATLGSLTALTNTTYPNINPTLSIAIPNHWGCIHSDGAAYFLDFKNGQGLVHKIRTSKTTNEGDTNNASAYNVLDLPFGFYPVSICSYSTDVAILTIQTTDSTINQGRAALFIWDTTNTDTFYRGPVYLPDPLATAMLYLNGSLNIWTGNSQNGFRVSEYIGGDTVKDSAFFEEGQPPLQGAVDALGNRLVWGGSVSYPETAACVWALGSKNARLGGGIHNIVKASSTGTTPSVTALAFIQQDSNITPKVIVGWRDGTGSGIDKASTTATYGSVWRSEVFNLNRKFKVTKIIIPLGATTATNMTLTAKVFFDDASSSTTLPTINSANYPSKRSVTFKSVGTGLSSKGGENNFFLELKWTGTVALPVLFPIEIEVDSYADESA